MPTHNLQIILLVRAGCAHRVRLSGTRLAIRQKGDIVTLREGAHAFAQVLPDALLIGIWAKDPVKDEKLAPLWRIDREARVGLHLHHRPLESLGYEIEARVGGPQWRADADGCEAKSRVSKSSITPGSGVVQREVVRKKNHQKKIELE